MQCSMMNGVISEPFNQTKIVIVEIVLIPGSLGLALGFWLCFFICWFGFVWGFFTVYLSESCNRIIPMTFSIFGLVTLFTASEVPDWCNYHGSISAGMATGRDNVYFHGFINLHKPYLCSVPWVLTHL